MALDISMPLRLPVRNEGREMSRSASAPVLIVRRPAGAGLATVILSVIMHPYVSLARKRTRSMATTEVPTLDHMLLLATRLSTEDRLRLIAHLALQLAETLRAPEAAEDDQALARRILQIREILRTQMAEPPRTTTATADDQSLERRMLWIREIRRVQEAETLLAMAATADDQSFGHLVSRIHEILTREAARRAATDDHPLLELDNLIAESKTPGPAATDSAAIISEIRR